MLEQFLIFSKGGLILYQTGSENLPGNPVAQLIASVLLENRGGDSLFRTEQYTVQWYPLNEFDIIFVVRSSPFKIHASSFLKLTFFFSHFQ